MRHYLLLASALLLLHACAGEKSNTPTTKDSLTTDAAPVVHEVSFRNPEIMDGRDILSMMQALQKEKKYAEMERFIAGPMISMHGREKVASLMQELVFPEEFKFANIEEASNGFAMFYDVKEDGEAFTITVTVHVEDDTARIFSNELLNKKLFVKGTPISQ